METKKVKVETITANEMYLKLLHENDCISTQELMIEFAKQKASEKFDAECNKNVILMCYPIDKIV